MITLYRYEHIGIQAAKIPEGDDYVDVELETIKKLFTIHDFRGFSNDNTPHNRKLLEKALAGTYDIIYFGYSNWRKFMISNVCFVNSSI